MAVTVTNAQQPRYVGYLGTPPRVETRYKVDTANVGVGDFVILGNDGASPVPNAQWQIYTDAGGATATTYLGGLYLGQDPGIINSILPTPGIDVVGAGVFNGEGSTGSGTPAANMGAVLVLSPGVLIEMDTLATATPAGIFTGLKMGITGIKFVNTVGGSDPASGWYANLDATTTTDDLVEIDEILTVTTGTTIRGRATVKMTGNDLNPGV